MEEHGTETRPRAVVIGLGQLGRTLAEGLVVDGWTVTGVRRDQSAAELATPELAVVATGEDDLGPVLAGLPGSWRTGHVLLLQNELLPPQWEVHGIIDPTVLIVWFSRKPGELIRELRPSVAFGPHADDAARALAAVGLHTTIAPSYEALLAELVEKNTYIWAMNLAALLISEPTTSRVLGSQRATFEELAREAIAVQEAAIGARVVDAPAVIEAVAATLAAEGERRLGGRSAARRAERLSALARTLGVDAPLAAAAAQPR